MVEEMGKNFLTLKRLLPILRRHRKKRKKVVFTNGCFDLIHSGHIHLLQAAASMGDILVVGINSDSSVRRLKGKGKPLFPLRERAEILSSIEYVDYVIPFSASTPARLIDRIVPDVLVKGSDWKPTEIVGREAVQKSGGKVKTVRLKKGISSSVLIERAIGQVSNEG
jgi:D-beta-D-heptose 7-phosphate kinase/D-beta-D-heptose 1-phosphate adenosyltransferase